MGRFLRLLKGILFFFTAFFNAQDFNLKLGAYYFDRWWGEENYHVTNSLKNDYLEKELIWGWNTSTQSVMDEQIELASDAGIRFFNFCWYYTNSDYDKQPLNHAQILFQNSVNSNKMEFCLLVVNDDLGLKIGDDNWKDLVRIWIEYFKKDHYLKINNTPYLSFLSLKTLIITFGGNNKVKKTLQYLRSEVKKAGFKDISGICVNGSNKEIKLAESCGFNIITSYNNHKLGYKDKLESRPISLLQKREYKLWDKMVRKIKQPVLYIPIITLNWDTRSWLQMGGYYSKQMFYKGFSESSVYESFHLLLKWHSSEKYVSKEEIGFIYAWNEYGEGAWLRSPLKQILIY